MVNKCELSVLSASFFVCALMVDVRKNFKVAYRIIWLWKMAKMANEIVVKKNGETKIPAGIRRKFQIKEGTKLVVVETSEGILLKPKPKSSTWDLVGAYSHVATPEEVKKEIDKLREQDG